MDLALLAAWLVVFVVASRRGLPLAVGLLGLAVGLALSLGRGLSGLAADLAATAQDPLMLEVELVVLEICLFSELLARTGRMPRVAAALAARCSDARWILIGVPALVGVLPMPGGAMFTAPITDEVGDRLGLSAEEKTLSNYWFRHCWEFVWPLYPGVILAAGLARLPMLSFLVWTWPLGVAAFAVGLLRTFALAPAGVGARAAAAPAAPDPGLRVLWPIVTVVGLVALQLSLPVALAVVLAAYLWRCRLPGPELRAALRAAWPGLVLVLVFAAYALGRVLASTGLTVRLGAFLLGLQLPLPLLALLLPLAMGLLTGNTAGIVGITFPVLLPLVPPAQLGAFVQWMYCAVLAGLIWSPAHLCLSMTQEYFRADLARCIRLLLAPMGAVLAVSGLRLWLALA